MSQIYIPQKFMYHKFLKKSKQYFLEPNNTIHRARLLGCQRSFIHGRENKYFTKYHKNHTASLEFLKHVRTNF